MPVAVVVGGRAELVVGSVQQPTAETRAVRLHHGRGQGSARQLQDPEAPGALDEDLRVTVAVVVAGQAEVVYRPCSAASRRNASRSAASSARPVGARKLQDADAPRASDRYSAGRRRRSRPRGRRLSAVLSSQPPNRVPLAAVVRVAPVA